MQGTKVGDFAFDISAVQQQQAHLGCKVCNGLTGHITKSEVSVDGIVKLYTGCGMDDILDLRQQPSLILFTNATLWLCQISWDHLHLTHDLQNKSISCFLRWGLHADRLASVADER